MSEIALADAPPVVEPTDQIRVAYLLGAGATQGALDHANGSTNQLMSGLATDLALRLRAYIDTDLGGRPEYHHLVNAIVENGAAFERLVTFFDDAPSRTMRSVADRMRDIFAETLRAKLHELEDDIGDDVCELFAALVDMHNVSNNPEQLAGLLTLNYDVYVEKAIETVLGLNVDYGHASSQTGVKVIKLHGSFGWDDSWPIERSLTHGGTKWIPPGIRKVKADYPFNGLWAQGRDVLDCDVLRIIGCSLSANDWDLISLIFGAKFGHRSGHTMRVEVVGSPASAARIDEDSVFLEVSSVCAAPPIGDVITSAILGKFAPYSALTDDELGTLSQKFPQNAFRFWLLEMAEHVSVHFGTDTDSGCFSSFVDSYAGK